MNIQDLERRIDRIRQTQFLLFIGLILQAISIICIWSAILK